MRDLRAQLIHARKLAFAAQPVQHPHANRLPIQVLVKIYQMRFDLRVRVAAESRTLADVGDAAPPHIVHQSQCNIDAIRREHAVLNLQISRRQQLLAPHAAHLNIWATEYIHVLDNVEAIVEWYKGTGMRPFLDALTTDAERARFTADYLAAIRSVFPPRS